MWIFTVVLSALLWQTAEVLSSPESLDINTENLYCRDSWYNNATFDVFSEITCSKCYVQTFFDKRLLRIEFPPQIPMLLISKLDENVTFVSHKQQDEICAYSLTDDDCQRWKDCCAQAVKCCTHEQQYQYKDPSVPSCPPTWDGVSCWPATAAAIKQGQVCPAYYMPRDLHWLAPLAYKECDASGNWIVHPVFGWDITDYENCFDTTTNIDVLKAAIYIDITGNSVSIILLLLAIIIISASRNLRLELLGRDSVRIHFNLFFSMLILGICNIIMDSFFLVGGFKSDDNPPEETPVNSTMNSTMDTSPDNNLCTVVHILAAYFRSSTYMGMFCEGLYLYKRISNVMRVGIQDSIVKYYIISWAVPMVTVGSYAIVRFVAFDTADSCVAEGEYYYVELIHLVPNLISLACNVLFLVSIEFMLCTKLRSDTTDRRVQVLRSALRATLSLIPIFGIQFLFIIYRPAYWPPYEILSALFTSTQGALVAILFCFANKDVKEELRNVCYDCYKRKHRNMSVISTATKASHVFVQPISVDSAHSKRMFVKIPGGAEADKRGSLPDVVSTANKRRRESNWSTMTTNTVINGSASGGSGRSLSSINSSRSDIAQRDRSQSLESAAFKKERPHSLGVEMIEMCEPLMDTASKAVEVQVQEDNISLTDIEEEKTSQLSPIVEVDV